MHLGRLDLNLLIALDALLSEKNVTRAAERLNISQPGMSSALQKLRTFFADRLLERIGSQLELTPRARALAAPVKDILSDIKALTAAADEFEPATTRCVVRIAASSFCCDLLAPPVIRHLSMMAPLISCQFEELQAESLQRLVSGQIDFAITIAQRLFGNNINNETLENEPLFDDYMVLVVAENNRSIGDTLTIDELCEQPYAETRFGNDLMGIGEHVWQQQSKMPRVRAWLPNFQLTMETVSRSELVAMLPSRMVERYHDRYGVRALPVPLSVPPLEERLFWHPRNNGAPAHRWFKNLIKTVVKEQGLIDDEPRDEDAPPSASPAMETPAG